MCSRFHMLRMGFLFTHINFSVSATLPGVNRVENFDMILWLRQLSTVYVFQRLYLCVNAFFSLLLSSLSITLCVVGFSPCVIFRMAFVVNRIGLRSSLEKSLVSEASSLESSFGTLSSFVSLTNAFTILPLRYGHFLPEIIVVNCTCFLYIYHCHSAFFTTWCVISVRITKRESLLVSVFLGDLYSLKDI